MVSATAPRDAVVELSGHVIIDAMFFDCKNAKLLSSMNYLDKTFEFRELIMVCCRHHQTDRDTVKLSAV
jgi:hypothetical protein